MNRDDYDRLATTLTAVAELYGKSMSPAVIALWWQALQRFDFEQVSKAIRAHTENAETGQFMPKPADLIRTLEGTATDRSQLAWGRALEAASGVGAYSDVVFDDPAIHAAIQDLGGWPKFCRAESGELSYLQHRFCESYRAYASRGVYEYPKRLCGDRSPDEMFRRRGMEPPKPAVIGDVKQARLVYQAGRLA